MKHNSSILENIFFIQAFSGCDTTSSLFSIGKLKFISTLERHTEFLSSVELFKREHVDPEVLTSTRERFLIALYGGKKHSKHINALRYQRYAPSPEIDLTYHSPNKKRSITTHIPHVSSDTNLAWVLQGSGGMGWTLNGVRSRADY